MDGTLENGFNATLRGCYKHAKTQDEDTSCFIYSTACIRQGAAARQGRGTSYVFAEIMNQARGIYPIAE